MIRVGLVGFGLAGRVFHAPLISSVEGFELVSVVERTTNEAETRYPSIQTIRSFEELLADSSLNLIVVATPGSTHFDFARRALESGKHVVVDKPMALHSAEIAQIATLAAALKLLAVPFQSRRWDSDFLTLSQVIHEGSLGRIVSLESRMDRWSPGRTRKPWKNIPEEGGILLDLGTHLVDQALVLFGKPLGVSAEVDRERDGDGANDAFTIRLRYAGHRVTLGSNVLSSIPGFRYSLRGTKGSFRKHGIDPQEAALGKTTHITSHNWGQEPMHDWGVKHVDLDGGIDTESVESIPGDYRQFYVRLREAINSGAPPPALATEAWRTARVLEWAVQSSAERREIECDFSKEPML
jgi:scyllo-inositol 2-dehydrogenase (NADP+)